MATLNDKIGSFVDLGCPSHHRIARLLSTGVLAEFDARDSRWPGKRKSVTYWWRLESGHLVAMNESGAGIGFEVIAPQDKQ